MTGKMKQTSSSKRIGRRRVFTFIYFSQSTYIDKPQLAKHHSIIFTWIFFLPQTSCHHPTKFCGRNIDCPCCLHSVCGAINENSAHLCRCLCV